MSLPVRPLAVPLLLLFVLATGCDAGQSTVGPKRLSLPTIDGRTAAPFGTNNAKAIAFVFLGAECPISNRYAPEVQRLYDKFAAQGAAFWLVYPNIGESDEAVRQHIKEFRYSTPVLRDPKHELVRMAKVRVTPEAAIFRRTGELIYHGRIDDRNVDFGKERPDPTTHDFEEALSAALNGKTPKPAGGRAVGCPIQ
jgi:hypothetical protein